MTRLGRLQRNELGLVNHVRKCIPGAAATTPGNKNLGQLAWAAKAVLDYYGPVIDELSVEAKERDLLHMLETRWLLRSRRPLPMEVA
jgi:hypothetical protein